MIARRLRGSRRRATRTCWKNSRRTRHDVIAVRKDAKDRQEVVVVGRIGGRVNPWIKGAAAFSIVDRSLKPCNEIEGDTCKTPWDYCCESGSAEGDGAGDVRRRRTASS